MITTTAYYSVSAFFRVADFVIGAFAGAIGSLIAAKIGFFFSRSPLR